MCVAYIACVWPIAFNESFMLIATCICPVVVVAAAAFFLLLALVALFSLWFTVIHWCRLEFYSLLFFHSLWLLLLMTAITHIQTLFQLLVFCIVVFQWIDLLLHYTPNCIQTILNYYYHVRMSRKIQLQNRIYRRRNRFCIHILCALRVHSSQKQWKYYVKTLIHSMLCTVCAHRERERANVKEQLAELNLWNLSCRTQSSQWYRQYRSTK